MRMKTKKQVWLLALCLVLLGLFIGPSTGVGQNHVDFILVGENLVAVDSTDGNYAEIMSNILRNSKQDLTSFNLTGNNVSLEQLQRWLVTDQAVKRSLQQPKLVVLTIGYTDLINHVQAGQVPNEEFKLAYQQKLTALLKLVQENTKAQIVIGDLYNPYPPKHPRWGETEELVKELNIELYDQAWENNIAVAPVYETFASGAKGKSQTLVNNNFYPNGEGQQAIADAFYRIVKQVKFN